MKKQVNQIMIFIGLTVALVGLFLTPIIDYPPFYAEASFITLGLLVVLAGTFIFAKNTVVKNVGYGLCVISGIVGASFLTSLATGLLIFAVGTLVMFLGTFIYYIVLVLTGLGWVKSDKQTKEDSATNLLTVLNNYKLLEKENILSEEEFNTIKANLLSSSSNKAESIEDLKKWKKAVEQKVITEEEYNAIKTEILSK